MPKAKVTRPKSIPDLDLMCEDDVVVLAQPEFYPPDGISATDLARLINTLVPYSIRSVYMEAKHMVYVKISGYAVYNNPSLPGIIPRMFRMSLIVPRHGSSGMQYTLDAGGHITEIVDLSIEC